MSASRRRVRVAIAAATVLSALGLLALFGDGAPGPALPVAAEPTAPPPPELEEVPGEISTATLLRELADLGRLASLPSPPYDARLASSWDRRSKSPEDAEGWFANDDWASTERPNFLRTEERDGRREHVIFDETGPGAVVRIWSATPAGTLRIYLDGATSPEIEAAMSDLLSGKGPFPTPFAYIAARGYNLYFPIPYSKGCKITIDTLVSTDPFNGGPLEKMYYQVNARAYPADVAGRVRTFRSNELPQISGARERAAEVLRRPDSGDVSGPARRIVVLAGDPPEAGVTAPGGGVVRRLFVRLPDRSAERLRSIRMEVVVDGERTIDAPVGDFFGSAPGFSEYESLPLSVRADGTMISRFSMPFRRSLTVRFLGGAGLTGELAVEPETFTDRSLLLHATFRPPTDAAGRPPHDLSFLRAEGEGIYVGNMMSIRNPPDAHWWGEGDEKIYVDDEPFPAWFGTGTEDYYGYAWSTPERFSTALHSQTRADGPRFSGWFSMNRFHTLDAVPFRSSLRFDLELWHWQQRTVTWSAVSYWYGRPGAKDR